MGRYLKPDPALSINDHSKNITFSLYSFIEDPQQFNLYVYAENSPISKSDPLGLFTIEGDCQGKGNQIKAGAESACANIDKVITCPKIAACMKKRCAEAKIKCKCCDNPDTLGYNKWILNIPLSTIVVCANHGSLVSKLNGVLLHEWAHSCGWDHGGGCGVPGQGGRL
jgi:hypothetical protein